MNPRPPDETFEPHPRVSLPDDRLPHAAIIAPGHTLATVTDKLGRSAVDHAHFSICNRPHKQGFTG